MWNMVTLDGFFEGPRSWDLDWHDYLGLSPLVLGSGNPLFKPGAGMMKVKLLEARPLASGSVILRYQPDQGAP